MKISKYWKYFMPILAFGIISSAFYIMKVDNNSDNNSTINTSSKSNNLNSRTSKIDAINFTLSDIVDSYRGGFNVFNVSEIVLALPNAQNASSPDLAKKFIDITLDNNRIVVSNTFNTNVDLWDLYIDTNQMQTVTSISEDDLPAINRFDKNYFGLTEYNNSTSVNGLKRINWASDQIDPNDISGNYLTTNSNSFLFQLSVVPKTNSNLKPDIFVKIGDSWEKPENTYGYSNVGNITMEGFFVQDLETGNIKYYVPKIQDDNTNPGTWKINNNDVANSYLNMPIAIAYDTLSKNKSDISEIIDWRPNLLLPSMSQFPISLIMDTNENQLEFTYGSNNDFKYVFYSKISSGKYLHIYPYYFDTSNFKRENYPGYYVNILKLFIDYTEVSYIRGFTQGTYVLPDEWILDKNRYASQVSILELQQLIFDHLGNPASDSDYTNVILSTSVDNKSNLQYNNATGEISFNIVLTKYRDKDGQTQQDPSGYVIASNITINGFKTIEPTKFIYGNYKINDSSLVATDQTDETIKKIIVSNQTIFFNTLAVNVGGSSLSENDIMIINKQATNQPSVNFSDSGSIYLEVALTNNFLTSPNALPATSEDEPYTFTFYIYGYALVNKTTFNELVGISSLNDQLATDQTEESIRNIIINNKKLFFDNLPNDLDLTSNQDLKLDIIEKNNLGSVDINNNQSGYVKLHVIVARYNTETGTGYNHEYDLTIYGFKKIIPLSINTNVTIPNKQGTLISDEIKNTNDILELIKNNSALFFNNSTIPNNFYENIIIDNNFVTSNIDSSIQLTFSITINRYYDTTGVINPNNPPLKHTIYISGYKTISATKLNAGTYNVASKYQTYYPNDITVDELKNIIYKNEIIEESKIISGDIPPNFDPIKNIIITDENRNNLTGSISFYLNINLRYDEINGALVNTSFTNPVFITLNNFNSSSPTFPSVEDQLVITSEYPLLQQTNTYEMSTIINKYLADENSLNDSELKIMNQLKLFLYNTGFYGYKDTFNPAHIGISVINSINNLSGSLTLKFSLKKYMNSQGQIIEADPGLETTKLIVGFKQIVPTTINSSNEPFIVPLEYSNYLAETVANDHQLLLTVIQKYDEQFSALSYEKIVLGDLPPGFDYQKNLIISNVEFNEITSRISFDLTLNLYYNSYNGNVNDGSPIPAPVKVVLTGFRTVPSTTINENPINNSYFYPTVENPTKAETLKVNIQNKSTEQFVTAQMFVNNLVPHNDNTTIITNSILNKVFYYTNDYYDNDINKNNIMIIYNPEQSKTLQIDAIVINDYDNKKGTVSLTVRARGYYFSRSSTPIQIRNIDNQQNYAYMDIEVSGFKPSAEWIMNINQPYIIAPIIIVSCITLLFIIIVIYHLSKYKQQPKKEDFIV